MANIPFTHQTIVDGSTQVSATTMQTVFDAIRSIVDHSGFRGSYELDADTVSGYGIGVDSPTYTQADLDTIQKGGVYRCQYAVGRHFPGTNDIMLFCLSATNTVGFQIAMDLSTYYWYKRRTAGGSGTWYQIWDAHADGNGGQPPAPKPNGSDVTKNSLGVGQSFFEDATSGSSISMPNCGGTVDVEILSYGVTFFTGPKQFIAAGGGAIISTVTGNCRIKFTRVTA